MYYKTNKSITRKSPATDSPFCAHIFESLSLLISIKYLYICFVSKTSQIFALPLPAFQPSSAVTDVKIDYLKKFCTTELL